MGLLVFNKNAHPFLRIKAKNFNYTGKMYLLLEIDACWCQPYHLSNLIMLRIFEKYSRQGAFYAHLSANASSSKKICRSSFFYITKHRLRNKKSICFDQIMGWYEQIFGHFIYECTQIISFELLDAFASTMNYKSSLTCVTSLMDRFIRHLINSHWLFACSIENFAILF